jgi:hypothetical protein
MFTPFLDHAPILTMIAMLGLVAFARRRTPCHPREGAGA